MLVRLISLLAATILLAHGAYAQNNLTELSIEELLTIEVTSVAKKRQRVEDAPAAVFVITSEDIRRSGATRLTDVFRMVPGVQVGENDSNSVAVSARGFNERLSNKLLVLIDGRAIYRSVLSGVFWDQVLVPLQEIERIEVVRGPGATLWGANAVNGVINVITKHPVDTQEGLVSIGGGNNELGRVYTRWGGLLGDDGAYRFYARGDIREGLVDAEGNQINENARAIQTGFRVDWEPTGTDAFTFQGDVQRGELESIATTAALIPGFPDLVSTHDYYGFNLLGRWVRSGTRYGDTSVQGFVDFLDRGELGSEISSLVAGLEFQHTLPTIGRHELIWGTNLQITVDSVEGDLVRLGEGRDVNRLFGLFVQDEIALIDEELKLTLGTKLEYNDFSGFEIQPSARLFWRPAPELAFWGAVSRAVRTPALYEDSLQIVLPPFEPGSALNPGPFPLQVGIVGSENLRAEDLYAFELGTRFDVTDAVSVDIAGYYNRYENLIVLDNDPLVFGPGGILQTVSFVNGGEATSFGAEISADWRVNDWWRLRGAYSYQNIDYTGDADTSIDSSDRFEGLTPRHQGSLRSQFDLTPEVELDFWFRTQSGLTESGVAGYVDMDVRLGWRPRADLELSITGRNLLQGQRQDFNQSIYPSPPGQVERSVFGQIEFKF